VQFYFFGPLSVAFGHTFGKVAQKKKVKTHKKRRRKTHKKPLIPNQTPDKNPLHKKGKKAQKLLRNFTAQKNNFFRTKKRAGGHSESIIYPQPKWYRGATASVASGIAGATFSHKKIY